MSLYIKEIYKLNKKQYALLIKGMNEKILMDQLRHFKVGEINVPITSWVLFYYIDKHGDFINSGKLKHHIIARAVYESMGSRSKREILEYIYEKEEGIHDE